MTRHSLTALAVVLGVMAGSAIEAKTDCNRACLTGFADTYLKALAANSPGTVPLAPNATAVVYTAEARQILSPILFYLLVAPVSVVEGA